MWQCIIFLGLVISLINNCLIPCLLLALHILCSTLFLDLFYFIWGLRFNSYFKHGVLPGVPVVVKQRWIWLVSMRMQVWTLASLSGLRIQQCHELWYRSQTQLGSCVAMAVVWASSYSSYSTHSLGTFICYRYSPKKIKKETPQETYLSCVFKAYYGLVVRWTEK